MHTFSQESLELTVQLYEFVTVRSTLLLPKVPCASALSSVWLALISSPRVGVGVGVGVRSVTIGAKVTPIAGVGAGVGDASVGGFGVILSNSEVYVESVSAVSPGLYVPPTSKLF